jgi:hypothetical protein
MTLLVGLRSLRLFMRMLFQLVKRGWRVVTEVHTTQWLIVSLVPSSALTAIVAFLGEHSVAVLATVFFLALVASALVVVAILGYRKEKEAPAARAQVGEEFHSWTPQLAPTSRLETGPLRGSQNSPSPGSSLTIPMTGSSLGT